MTTQIDPLEPKKQKSEETSSVNVSGQEYRLVPVGEWGNSYPYNPDDEIDLVDLLKTLWDERKTILAFTIMGAILGILIGILSPREYTVTATLLPEYNTESQGGASRLLQQFGGLAGISAADLNQASSIRPDLYPEIVQTTGFQKQLMYQKFYVSNIDSQITLYTYLSNIQKPGLVSTLAKWTIGLPGMLFSSEDESIITPPTSDNNRLYSDQILILSEKEMLISNQLSERVTASLNNKSGIITLTVKFQDPILSANVGQYVVDQLTEYITDYRTDKLKRDLLYTEQRLEEAKARFEIAMLNLSEFQESTQGSITARARKGEEFLQSEFQIAFGIYNTLTQQFEQQTLKLQEETPVFKTLQAVYSPTHPTDPNKALIVVLFTMVCIIASLFVIFVKKIRHYVET